MTQERRGKETAKEADQETEIETVKERDKETARRKKKGAKGSKEINRKANTETGSIYMFLFYSKLPIGRLSPTSMLAS